MRVKNNSRESGRRATKNGTENKIRNEKEVEIRVENWDIITSGKTAQITNLETIIGKMRVMLLKKGKEIQVETEKLHLKNTMVT